MNPLRLLAPGLAVSLALGCAFPDPLPTDLASYTSAEEVAPLGGAALIDRRQLLERTLQDLGHFHTTLESMAHRGDGQGIERLSDFLHVYLQLHLDALLRPTWQSRHLELMVLDANLRFAEADLLIRMGALSSAQRLIDELEDRFADRREMLIQYPVGVQRTLGVGLEYLRADRRQRALRSRKWHRSS